MKLELAASGLTEEEILEKAKLLMRAFGKEEAGSTAEFMLMSKQTNAALVQAGLPPKDFTSVSTLSQISTPAYSKPMILKSAVNVDNMFVLQIFRFKSSVDKVVCEVA